MRKNKPMPKPADIASLAVECIQQMTPDEALAYLMYREPGIPETDMNGDLLEMYREQREAEAREAGRLEAETQTPVKSAA